MKNKNNTILNLNEHIKILKDQKIYLLKEIDKFSKIIIKTILKGGKILIIGNGGSAADAQHFATELTVKMNKVRKALPVIALITDTSALTAIGNDFSFDKSPQDDDLRHEKILIDKTSADLLKGSEIDFVKELIGDQFKISNPQSKSSCGCGVSFSL